MASNPYVNKVQYAGQTLMDLTSDTVSPSDVLAGETFHDRSGAPQTGNLITHNVIDNLTSDSSVDALSAKQGKALNTKMSEMPSYKSIVIAKGGTTLTIDNGSRIVIDLISVYGNQGGTLYVYSTNAGVVYAGKTGGNNVSISAPENNKLLVNPSDGACTAYATIYAGDIS